MGGFLKKEGGTRKSPAKEKKKDCFWQDQLPLGGMARGLTMQIISSSFGRQTERAHVTDEHTGTDQKIPD